MPDVVVVGGGPSGLAAAVALRRQGVGDVVVIDREAEAGGVPRHCNHLGFGIRDLGRVLGGPAYARGWVRRAIAAGVDVRTASTVTGWRRTDPTSDDPRAAFLVDVTSPAGRYPLPAGAIVLATGCRERPRAARLVPGSRPAGVLTTGQLQQAVHLEHQQVGTRAVVVGAEHVSYSAVLTLAEAGCDVVAMTTEHRRATSFAAFDAGARVRWRFPLLPRTVVSDIVGRGRVQAVELTDLDTATTRMVACDTVVFTGDWIADHELARRHDVVWDHRSSGLSIDTGQRTSADGVFAVGNVVHPAETADVCAHDGLAVAGPVCSWLAGRRWPHPAVRLVASDPLSWIAPSWVSDATSPPRGRFVMRGATFLRTPQLVVAQGDRTLWRGRVRAVVPDRSFSLPARWLPEVDRSPSAPDVEVALHH